LFPNISTGLQRSLLLFLGTLALACTETSEPPAAVSPTWQQTSVQGLYMVTVAPRDGVVPIGQYHEWEVSIFDKQGNPVASPRISMDGSMPGHGHGLPSQPQITDPLGQGKHRIEGVRFNMAGDWELDFQIQSAMGIDQVKFPIELSF